MAEKAVDAETCLDICKNDVSCARANWYQRTDIGLCRMFTIGAAECKQDRGEPQNESARRVVNQQSMSGSVLCTYGSYNIPINNFDKVL